MSTRIPSFPHITHIDIVVAQDGTADFTTITNAINSLPMYTYERVVIFIKNGTYHEKIRIENHHITIIGESREKTIISYSQPRPDWEAQKDHIGPGIINIHADDCVLKNLTVINSQEDTLVHAFVLYGDGTRTITENCSFISQGGDTVALWNYKAGMYYHANCYFQGAVDFVCPRGWCYIDNCQFYEVRPTAAIWHAATDSRDQKLVICNSTFDGVDGYHLGRHHYEAQFFLLHCTFSNTMVDRPLYQERSNNPRPYFFGDRHYFDGCHRDGGDYGWFADNLPRANVANSAPLSPTDITASWTFDNRWNPETTTPTQLIKATMQAGSLYLFLTEPVTIRGNLILADSAGNRYTFAEGRGRDILRFEPECDLGELSDVQEDTTVHATTSPHCQYTVVSGAIIGNIASVTERAVKELSV